MKKILNSVEKRRVNTLEKPNKNLSPEIASVKMALDFTNDDNVREIYNTLFNRPKKIKYARAIQSSISSLTEFLVDNISEQPEKLWNIYSDFHNILGDKTYLDKSMLFKEIMDNEKVLIFELKPYHLMVRYYDTTPQDFEIGIYKLLDSTLFPMQERIGVLVMGEGNLSSYGMLDCGSIKEGFRKEDILSLSIIFYFLGGYSDGIRRLYGLTGKI